MPGSSRAGSQAIAVIHIPAGRHEAATHPGSIASTRQPWRTEHRPTAIRDRRRSDLGGRTMFEFGLIAIAIILIPALVILSLITLILVEQD